MGKNSSVIEFSKQISDFCNFLEETQKHYHWSLDEAHKMEQLTQDFLHSLELDNLNYKERAKIATKLSLCRKRRRLYKDTAEVLDPLAQFLESEKGRQLFNLTREALGKTRKVEERMKTRAYFPRVLKK